ncbi:MAG TPA: hypothetical protein VHW45_17050 [Candidatus Sulfotelmatobacter sp.]|jgi:hypothetical protein|nr:hypothetical protein [Candidatus Sulfotelmatobacter sp.]
MKFVNYLAIVAVSATLSPLCAFAGDKTARSVKISDPVTIGTTQLKPGEYRLEWEGAGPSVQVNFLRLGKTVATAPAQLQTNDPKVTQDEILMDRSNANAETLKEIDFGHGKEALVFAQSGM